MIKNIYNSRFVAFGDSITAGIGVPEGSRKWTQIIEERFKLDLVNSGIGGNTSSQGLDRIISDVIAHKPDFVSICFGMNDHCMLEKDRPKVLIQVFEKNIIQIVDIIRHNGAVPLLITPNYIIEGNENEYYYSRHNSEYYINVGGAQNWLGEYVKVIRSIARKLETDIIDVRKVCEHYDPYEFLRSFKNDTFADGVHPHTLGARVYASLIGDYLEKKYA